MAFEHRSCRSGPHDSHADPLLPFYGKMHPVQHLDRDLGSSGADCSSQGLDLGGY